VALNSTELIGVVVVVVLAVVIIGIFLYLLRRLRSRKSKLLGELDARPELSQDRAFNRIAMARREVTVLASQGVDVHRAQELIADAQGAFDTHHFDQAYRTAQSAHEALVNARQAGARTTGMTLGPTAPTGGAAPREVPSAGPTSPAETPPRTQIPKNRAESQFQIKLLGEELDGLPPRRAREHGATEAAELKLRATTAFENGDYTEAFRLALRGRRALGSTLETLPLTGAGESRSLPATSPGSNGATPDIARTAEGVAGGDRCPDCGYPTLSGDAFCRGCGRPRTPLSCPTCGAPRAADEPFCGRCGTRFP